MTTDDDAGSYDDVDVAALALSIQRARELDDATREQIDKKLTTDRWEKVGLFASYCCQIRSLRLKPWQTPPVLISDLDADYSDDPGKGAAEAAALLRQMFDLNISQFHPDPLAAIASALRMRDKKDD